MTSPQGWKISDEENLDDQGYYLSIEKDGLESSGLFSLTWVYGEFELNDWIRVHKEEMKNNIIYRNSNLAFGGLHESKFNNLNTSSLEYTVSLLGVKHEGTFHFFHAQEKTFTVVIQEAIEDRADNRAGFEMIEQSFKVE